jgi:hypothetical protein
VPLAYGKSDPDLEQRVGEDLLVLAEVDGSQSDALDDSFNGGAIGFRGGEEHVRRPVGEDRVGHVRALERHTRPRRSSRHPRRGVALPERLAIDSEVVANERVVPERRAEDQDRRCYRSAGVGTSGEASILHAVVVIQAVRTR